MEEDYYSFWEYPKLVVDDSTKVESMVLDKNGDPFILHKHTKVGFDLRRKEIGGNRKTVPVGR